MKYYRVEKHEGRANRWLDYGTMCIEDVKLIIKGYRKNTDPDAMALFGDDELEGMYIRKGSSNFYSVELA